MTLQEEIEQTRQEIWIDSYSLSIGEWISLYQKQEIALKSEQTKTFYWTPSQKSAFIESILLGIPISPIFVYFRNDGIWDVIDGRQRLLTIFEFTGVLNSPTRNQTQSNTSLQEAFYLKSLSGKKWHEPNDLENSLTEKQRLLIKRTKIIIYILEKQNDPLFKDELELIFHRNE